MQPTSLKKGKIDWLAVHGRLRASERALGEALTPNAQRVEAAYRRRAVSLAQEEKENSAAPAGLPVLVFRLGPERYAIEVRHLAEVLAFGYHAVVPRSPAKFLGVISLRGELRAVVDLRRLLTLTTEPSPSGLVLPSGVAAPPGFVLMLRARAGSEQIGLKVDGIEELGQIRPEELTQTAPGSCVAGLASGSLSLLDVAAVLARVFSNYESNGESFTK